MRDLGKTFRGEASKVSLLTVHAREQRSAVIDLEEAVALKLIARIA